VRENRRATVTHPKEARVSPTALHRRAASSAICALALLAVAAPAVQAEPVHEVAPGESLWQVAAVNGLSPSALAAANGLSPDAAVQAGQALRIPAGGGVG
jgi:LysM repeat protein